MTRFYVTCRDAGLTAWLLGPYASHEEALANVQRGSRLAEQADPRAAWYAFGTAGVSSESAESRPINTVFGL